MIGQEAIYEESAAARGGVSDMAASSQNRAHKNRGAHSRRSHVRCPRTLRFAITSDPACVAAMQSTYAAHMATHSATRIATRTTRTIYGLHHLPRSRPVFTHRRAHYSAATSSAACTHTRSPP